MKRAETREKGANFGCYGFLLHTMLFKSTTQSEFLPEMTVYLKFYVLLH